MLPVFSVLQKISRKSAQSNPTCAGGDAFVLSLRVLLSLCMRVCANAILLGSVRFCHWKILTNFCRKSVENEWDENHVSRKLESDAANWPYLIDWIHVIGETGNKPCGKKRNQETSGNKSWGYRDPVIRCFVVLNACLGWQKQFSQAEKVSIHAQESQNRISSSAHREHGPQFIFVTPGDDTHDACTQQQVKQQVGPSKGPSSDFHWRCCNWSHMYFSQPKASKPKNTKLQSHADVSQRRKHPGPYNHNHCDEERTGTLAMLNTKMMLLELHDECCGKFLRTHVWLLGFLLKIIDLLKSYLDAWVKTTEREKEKETVVWKKKSSATNWKKQTAIKILFPA